MNFNNLTNGQSEGFAIVKQCDEKTTAKGSTYLDMKLSDKSGEINAKLWDYSPLIHGSFSADSVVKVRGEISKYQGNDQLRISKIRLVNASGRILFSLQYAIISSCGFCGCICT